jgi:hypothetical protein
MSEKPEWFEITEDDQKPNQNELPRVMKSRNSRLKVALIAVPVLAVGTFAVAAHGGEDDAPALPKLSAASNSTAVATTTPAVTHTAKVSSTKEVKNVSNTQAKAPSNPGSGIKAPSGNGENHNEGFGDDNSEHKDGHEHHHEDGDHEGRSNAPKIPQSGSSTTKN